MTGETATPKPKKPRKPGPPRRSSRYTISGQASPTVRLGNKGGSATLGKERLDTVLTERQQLFVNAVARDGMNFNAALRQAGYSDSPGTRNSIVGNAKIQHAIAIEKAKYAQASQMTKKKVIDGFLEAIDMARIKADPIVMVAGWREVAKMCGFYEPTRHKLEVSVNGQVVIHKLQQLDDTELLRLAEGDTDALEGEFTVVQPEEAK
jgi:hypothetical protein